MPPAVWCEDLDRNTLARVIDALPSHLRAVARLRFQMRWSCDAIASTLDLPCTTVAGRVRMAREAIAQLVAAGAALVGPPPHLVHRAWMHLAGLT